MVEVRRPWRMAEINPPVSSLARWALAVCAVMPASFASSLAVSALPLISAASMLARAGSPASAATGAMFGPSFILRRLANHRRRGKD